MSAPIRATLRSPFRSPAAVRSAVHGLIRRNRLARLSVLTLVGTVLVLRVFAAIDAAEHERARWGPPVLGWVTTADIPAGAVLETSDVAAVDVPPALLPAGAVTGDPSGQRARVDLAAGELIVTARVLGDRSANAARTPPGTVAIALDRTSDLFVVGDRVDLHDQIDGGELASDALVIAVTDGDVAVAVDAGSVGDVVRSLGRGGVIAVLRGG